MKNNSSNGIGMTGLLQVAFIVLKLCKVIDWSWFWVLAPTWIAAILAIISLIITLGVAIYFVKAYLCAKNTIKEQKGTIKCLNEVLDRKERSNAKDQH